MKASHYFLIVIALFCFSNTLFSQLNNEIKSPSNQLSKLKIEKGIWGVKAYHNDVKISKSELLDIFKSGNQPHLIKKFQNGNTSYQIGNITALSSNLSSIIIAKYISLKTP